MTSSALTASNGVYMEEISENKAEIDFEGGPKFHVQKDQK